MIRKLSGLIFIFTFITMMVNGQDLIVTQKGDSIQVRISTVERERIYFSREIKGNKIWSYASRDTIDYFERNFYPSVNTKEKPRLSMEKFRAGLNGGVGFQTGKYTLSTGNFDGRDNYLKGLQIGYSIGAQAEYYFMDILGAGLRYSFFSATNSAENVTMDHIITPDTVTVTGTLRENVMVNFIGPEFVIRAASKNRKIRYNTAFAFGLLTYRNEFSHGINSVATGVNFGMNLSFCPEFIIAKNFALGIDASLFLGSIPNYTQDYGNTSRTVELANRDAISLTRIDLGLSIKWIR